MSPIEHEYQSRMDALSGRERITRSLMLLAWSRQMLARRILAERGEMSEERLKWEVALRLYGSDPTVCRMIESELADVSG
jgi:hypothetical protein